MPTGIQAAATDLDPGLVQQVMNLFQSSPPTWKYAFLSNVLIFLLGSRLLVSGLSLSGISAAFLLGTLTWRAFGSSGFLLVATFFVLINAPEAVICVIASQIANLAESIIGAALQEKEGFRWDLAAAKHARSCTVCTSATEVLHLFPQAAIDGNLPGIR
ncbi:UNVERIFIED_CONTAM: protein VTE6, chloroplastic [Sesamum radiatum]|uniref:Protein VTE6, chloroplastic n=1 Tax=Sesamum radiatum TaxID=300843 RepID=A0AAW2LQX4_SESRA